MSMAGPRYQAAIRRTRGLVFYVPGLVPAAYSTGSNYVMPPRFTMECWVQWSGGVVASRGLFSNNTGSNGAMLWIGTGSRIQFTVNATNVESGIQPLTATWYHIAGTCDGTTSIVYVNGANPLGNTSAVAPNAVSTPLQVYSFFGGAALSGIVHDPAIYARALSAAEIQQHYVAGKATHS